MKMNSWSESIRLCVGGNPTACRCWSLWSTRESPAPPCPAASMWPIVWINWTWTASAAVPYLKKCGLIQTAATPDEWGVSYLPSPEAGGTSLRGPIATIDDALAYTRPTQTRRTGWANCPTSSPIQGPARHLLHHRAAFMWSAYLMGLDNMLMNLLPSRSWSR